MTSGSNGLEISARHQIPYPCFKHMTAPGPTGDKVEHLDALWNAKHGGVRRRIRAALDELTVQGALGKIAAVNSWLLNTIKIEEDFQEAFFLP